jgi:hypothetical protein
MARYVTPIQLIISTWLYEHYEFCEEVIALNQMFFITKMLIEDSTRQSKLLLVIFVTLKYLVQCEYYSII